MALSDIILKEITTDIDQYTQKIVPIMKSEVHKRSGLLRSCIDREKVAKDHYKVGVNVSRLKANSPNHTDYSQYYYFGRGEIWAKKGKVLRWVDESGKVHYAKHVKGYKGDPFLDRVMNRLPNL